LIEEAKEEANKNPDDALCRCISELAGSLESKGLPRRLRVRHAGSLCRSRKAARFDEENTRLDRALDPPYLDPPYKEMIAMAYNLRLLQDRKSGKKAKLTREELQEKIVEGRQGDYAAVA